ncbi:DUF6252 family protein [Flavobacterium sp. RNTU_13]|uniref:DUF6252 family protein n=1 Tax=Flavobacterium sp. RNTU_13 TaxID=3375145 RepID=UPI00398604C3
MKRINVLSFMWLVLVAIGFTACNTEPVDPALANNGGNNNTTAAFQVNIGADLYQASATSGIVANNQLTLTATDATGKMFTITVPAAVGEYSNPAIKYVANSSAIGYYSTTNPADNTVNGVVKILAYNATTRKVSGTFSFTGYYSVASGSNPPISFTSGVFTNIEFTTSATSTGLFKVDVANTTYTATSITATLGIGMIKIYTSDASGKQVAIQVYGYQVGDYTGSKAFASYYASATDEVGYSSNDVDITVKVTEINTANRTISGTFTFVGEGVDETDTKQFTNGVFTNVPYTTENADGDVMTATINGTAYDYKNSIAYVTTIDVGSGETVNFPAIGPDHAITPTLSTTLIPGSYALSSDTANPVHFTFTDAEGIEHEVTEGTVGITRNSNNRIAGTYQFTVKNDAGEVIYNITGGTFDVDYGM